MIRQKALPANIVQRIETLGTLFERCPEIVFAYLFGGAGVARLTPLSDVDVAVYLQDAEDRTEQVASLLAKVAAHLGTDEVDLVVLNAAPIALLGRILRTRRVICDRAPLVRHNFESRTFREFCDFRRFERRALDRRFEHG